jgi:hypothetical protein
MSVAVKKILRAGRPPGAPVVGSECVSPAFVHRLVREHGAASLLETSHLRDLPPDRALAFLLRCHKGRFYRNRYPSLSLVQGGES